VYKQPRPQGFFRFRNIWMAIILQCIVGKFQIAFAGSSKTAGNFKLTQATTSTKFQPCDYGY